MLRVQRVGPTSTTTGCPGPPVGRAAARAGRWTAHRRPPGIPAHRPPGRPVSPDPREYRATMATESTQSTAPEAPAEAATDTPTGSPREPPATLPDRLGGPR